VKHKILNMGGGTSKLQQIIAIVEKVEEAFQAGRLELAIKLCEEARYPEVTAK
jgi:hypothetical protein